MEPGEPTKAQIESERWEILTRLEDWLERPMVVLAFVWLALFVTEVVWGLSPFLQVLSNLIWGLFILDFLLRFSVAPDKRRFLRGNWLTLISLLAPALRVLRVARVLRLTRVAASTRGLRVLRTLSSVNRSMRALGASMSRRGVGYALALTAVVLFAGAAGMYALENHPNGEGLNTYGEALWWTAMMLTTIASEYWPVTPAGQLLCFLLSLYGFAVFGYITAALATYFVGRDAENENGEIAGARQMAALQREIQALREELRQRGRSEGGTAPEGPP